MSEAMAAEEQRGNGNLRPFPKGQSGNPGGRPKGSVGLRNRLRRMLAEDPAKAEAALEALAAKAAEGDIAAIKLLLDSVDGLLAVKIEGLSEHELRERIGRFFELLRDRLPPEYHQIVADCARDGIAGPEGRDD